MGKNRIRLPLKEQFIDCHVKGRNDLLGIANELAAQRGKTDENHTKSDYKLFIPVEIIIKTVQMTAIDVEERFSQVFDLEQEDSLTLNLFDTLDLGFWTGN